jgi:hypothetical protein
MALPAGRPRPLRGKGKSMDIKLVVSDGERIERVGRILLVLIARHRRARGGLDEVVKDRGGERSRSSGTTAESATRFVGFQSSKVVDVAAKAAYVRTLLATVRAVWTRRTGRRFCSRF